MSKKNDWIHTFAVTESRKHTKGFVIYKITSIVFPVQIPEALTCLTIWKRFSEVKKLHKEITKRHQKCKLKGQVPALAGESFNYFKRYDKDLIQTRKEFILKLLDFIGDHPELFKSQAYIGFFEGTITPPVTPDKVSQTECFATNSDAEASSCTNLQNVVDVDEVDNSLETNSASNSSSLFDELEDDAKVQFTTFQEDNQVKDGILNDSTQSLDFESHIPASFDYIYEAAFDFSRAVQAEVNQEYDIAHYNYKAGVEKLLDGARCDENVKRRTIAKEKSQKYLEKSNEIYEKYLLNPAEQMRMRHRLQISSELVASEWPSNQLSNLKVCKILGSVMQVQDVRDRQMYVVKGIQKPSLNSRPSSVYLPSRVPFMVPLVAYIQSECAIFLILQMVGGGKLMDYIRRYDPPKCLSRNLSLESILQDPTVDKVLKTSSKEEVNVGSDMELILEHEYFDQDVCPSFELLSTDMDVTELVNYSQKLIKSVDSTLNGLKEPTVIYEDNPNVDAIKCSQEMEESIKSEISINKLSNKAFNLLPFGIVRRWLAELATTINSLHEQNVICCDLRMDNLLLGSKGQLILTYFYRHFNEKLLNTDSVKNMFVAPERPFSVKSDWWSFGVIMFELVTGCSFMMCHPAGPTQYFELQFPEDVKLDDDVVFLLDGLLTIDTVDRFGFPEIKSHKLFKSIDWFEVEQSGLEGLSTSILS